MIFDVEGWNTWYCAPIHAKKLEIASHSYGYYQIMSDCVNTKQCKNRQVSCLVVNILAYPMESLGFQSQPWGWGF